MTKVCHFIVACFFYEHIFICLCREYDRIYKENLDKEVDFKVNKKWVITSIIAIVVILVGIVVAVGLSYDGKLTKEENVSSTGTIGENKVMLDYSLRLKEHEEYDLVVDKEQEVKFKYAFKSVDNSIKIIVKNKENNQEVNAFFINQEKGIGKGVEKVKIPAGEYTMEVIIPSLSKGHVTLEW